MIEPEKEGQQKRPTVEFQLALNRFFISRQPTKSDVVNCLQQSYSA